MSNFHIYQFLFGIYDSNPFSIYILVWYVTGVAGGAASGKTSVCDMIVQQLHDQRVVLVNQVSNSCKVPIVYLILV